MSTRESLPRTKCDSYLNQSLTNVPSILSHFSSSNASVFDRIVRSEERFSRNAETELVCRLLLEKKMTRPIKVDNSLPFDTRITADHVHGKASFKRTSVRDP